MIKYYYCNGWDGVGKAPWERWSEEEAKAAHKNGLPYTVLVNSPTRPFCFIDVVQDNSFLGVVFLDQELREYLEYYFIRQPSGKLFLTEAKFRQFRADRCDDSRDAIETFTHYKFSPDGNVTVREVGSENEVRDGSNKVDVSENYADYPVFGVYEDLIRLERGIK